MRHDQTRTLPQSLTLLVCAMIHGNAMKIKYKANDHGNAPRRFVRQKKAKKCAGFFGEYHACDMRTSLKCQAFSPLEHGERPVFKRGERLTFQATCALLCCEKLR
jgi:hypothetical protein